MGIGFMSPASSVPREFLAARKNWQAEANRRGLAGEAKIFRVLQSAFAELPGLGAYRVEDNPKHLSGLYGPNGQWGVRPDAAVTNVETGRTVFVEAKRQNPRGNAHERACKYLAPGMVSAGREKGNIREDDFPFFLIFANGLAANERYGSAIAFWFSNSPLENHFLLWSGDPAELLDFFLEKIRPVIDRPRS